MITDPISHRSTGGFPVDQPMHALEQDHNFVKQLFERYLNTQDTLVKHEAGPRILELLEMHMRLEEATFYPMVRRANEALVDQCKEQHEQAEHLVQQLRAMDMDSPQRDGLFRKLHEAVMQHVGFEEQQLFPAVRQANLDLEAIGLQMQMYESNMVSAQAQGSASRPGPRR